MAQHKSDQFLYNASVVYIAFIGWTLFTSPWTWGSIIGTSGIYITITAIVWIFVGFYNNEF